MKEHTMHDDIIEAPPGDTPVDLAIWLSPLQTWRSVYGNGFCEEAMRVCVERLTGLGIDAESLERAGDTVLVRGDRKSTRLNSSHTVISYAVFCLKKKKKKHIIE